MRFARITAAIGAAFALGAPASANWQFTHWNMTATEVIRASSGTAHLGSGAASAQRDGSTADVIGTFNAGGRPFDVQYYFQGGLLATVVLESRDQSACAQTEHDLEAVYGLPVERTSGVADTWLWLDRQKANRVKMIIVGGLYCELQYSPLVSAAASQL